MNRPDPYRGKDPREIPLYGIAEAAHHIHLPTATLRSWVDGRTYKLADGTKGFSPPLIDRPDAEDPRLSFNNLVEAHVLRALRVEHHVPMGHVRKALDYAQRECGIDRLLIRREKILGAFLRRVVRDAEGLPLRLYPGKSEERMVVAIDPRISYGRPSIARKGVSTAFLAKRFNAGETVEDLADSYGLTEEEVKEAIVYESARAA